MLPMTASPNISLQIPNGPRAECRPPARNHLRLPNVQPSACSGSPIIPAAHGSLPSRLPAAALQSYSPPMDPCLAACMQRLSNHPRRPWIFAKPPACSGSPIIPAAHGSLPSRLHAAALQSSPPPMDPCQARSRLRLYAIIIAAAWACIANSAALNVCACAMANSVRLRQSRINSPKNGYPTCPATAKCCSRC